MSQSGDTARIECEYIGSHTLDPEGDVVLVFNSKNAIVSDDHDVDLIDAECWNAMVAADRPEEEAERNEVAEERSELENEDQTERDNEEATEQESEEETENAGEHNSITSDLQEPPPCPTYSGGTADIEVLVSSKHLTLASPVFRAMLSKQYREGQTLQKDNMVKIPLPDDPIHGMIVLLKLLHFDFEQVKMTPALLMQVALLADKYDLAIQIAFWSRMWCEEIAGDIPESWRPEVISYIGMFSMLKVDRLKKKMIDLARGHVTETTSAGSLPIDEVIQKLRNDRLLALAVAFRDLAHMVEEYWSDDNSVRMCKSGRWTCDAVVLGSLLKGLKVVKFWPLLDPPYPGITIFGAVKSLQTIELKTECQRSGDYNDYWDRRNKVCIAQRLDDVIASLQTAGKLS